MAVPLSSLAQAPFYYKLRSVQGSVFDGAWNEIKARIASRNKLEFLSNGEPAVMEFLQTLTLGRIGRKQLEFLLTTPTEVTVINTNKIGLLFKECRYYLIVGITGPGEGQSDSLIELSDRRKGDRPWEVFEQSSIELFRGSLLQAHDPGRPLDRSQVKIFDGRTWQEVTEFFLDTISIEPVQRADLLYANNVELYYFCGIHEIHHLQPENVAIQLDFGDTEAGAFRIEEAAMKKRKAIMRRSSRRNLSLRSDRLYVKGH
jgi:hypothetical protein